MIALATQFVPATDEVWRLQRGSDPECRFFQAMADKGHYGGRPGASRQGIYICSPSGELLASLNSNRPERVLQAMQDGLQAWEQLPAEARRIPPANEFQPDHRWEASYPDQGLVLTMVTRDLPTSGDATAAPATKWNRDYVWFSRTEAREWFASPPQLGARHSVPESLVFRLARLHLVDTVKGQTQRFSRQQVTGTIETEVLQQQDGRVELAIRGETEAEAPPRGRRSSAHGVATRLIGTATYDLQSAAFVAFELVAVGKRWGYTRYNGRRRDSDSGPLGFVFSLAPKEAPRVAPTFIYAYDVDWVRRPETR